MKRILQLGAGELMKHSVRLIQHLGIEVYTADRNPSAPAFEISDGHAPIDLLDVGGITEFARRIGADAVLAVNEAGVLSAARASAALGLRNLAPDIAIRALDKGLMREAWRKAGLTQPDYRIVDSPGEIGSAATELGYPAIVKPTMGWGSRGVSLVSDETDIPSAAEFASRNRAAGRFIVEKFIRGTEATIEGLVQNGRPQILAKSDKQHQHHHRYRVAMSLNYPAQFPPPVLEQIDDIVIRAATALGINNCAIHCEAMVNDSGVFLIEMGARPGGGHIFGQIVEASSGVCMPQALAKILLGEAVDIRPRFQRGAVYRFFTPPAGVFRGVTGIEKARSLPGVLDFGFHMEPGRVVTAIEGDADRPGFAVTTGATRDEAMAVANRAVSMVTYTMDPLPEAS